MGLRCLLGHDFGEPETERERNEEGNEVVVSVREVKTCQRCGETQVVSENKEIKSIDQLRETATGEATAPDSTGGLGTDDSVDFGQEPAGATDQSSNDAADQWTADELDIGSSSAEPEPEPAAETEETTTAAAESEPEAVPEQDDDIDRGVAEIIESAEKDDEMLETDPEADAEDVGNEGEEESEGAAEAEDAVILDDESPPEDGREQWNEQAHPEEVPGRDKSGAEPRSPDDEDAIIMGGDAEGTAPQDTDSAPEPEPEQEPEPTQEEPSSTQSANEQPTAVESEDAEIMGSGSAEPEPANTADVREPTAEQPVQDEARSEEPTTEETTDEGHMPWPDAPGEDEGHDAEAPDGEPADIDFGGGITPDQPENEQNGAETSADSAESSTETDTSSTSSTSAAPEPSINLEQSSREAGLEYYCSECGHTRDVGNSSMRAGDICPECRKGYITERQKAE